MRSDEVQAAASRRGAAHHRLSQKALDRKNNKPIMEKKRRARINHCLNQLKALILETDSERSRHSKLEKADILEMTVRYLQTLRAYHLHLHQINHQLSSIHSQPHQLHTLQHFQSVPVQQQHQQQAAVSAVAATSQLLHLQLPHQQQQQLHQPPHHINAFQHHNNLKQQQQQQHQLINNPQVSPFNQISPTWRPW